MIDYKKLKISDTNRIKEQQIIDQISQCIDDGLSWIFNAGACSGKTYALVQSLKMLLDKRIPDTFSPSLMRQSRCIKAVGRGKRSRRMMANRSSPTPVGQK